MDQKKLFRAVKIKVSPNAEFHLNGFRGSAREKTLKVGNQVRILAALPEGAALVREPDPARMAVEETGVHAIFPTGRPSPMRFLNEDWQPDLLSILRPAVFLGTPTPAARRAANPGRRNDCQ